MVFIFLGLDSGSEMGLQRWLNVIPMHCLWHTQVFCNRSGRELSNSRDFIVVLT